MKRSKRQDRIEPSFDAPARSRRGPDMRVSADDRTAQPARRRSKRAPARAGLFSSLRRTFYWLMVLGLWGVIGLGGLVAYYGARMPSASTWAIPDRPPNVKIVSVSGAMVANRGLTGGEAIGLHEMSAYIPEAVIAIEDRRFYSHAGIDPIGLARALVTNVARGQAVQGASTLTQQLAKNLFLKPDRTLERKVQELLLAFWLEHKYSKDAILEMYLNRVYFGSGAYGVEAASRRYFNKPARDVTLAEAALLAGLLKAPTRLSPARDPKAANARAQLVLAAMAAQGMIGGKEMMAAKGTPATRAAAYWTGSEHYVADRIMADLPGLIGEINADIIVDTTIDLDLQKLAEKSIRRLIRENGAKLNVSQGALVSIDGSGAVRAMVGGYDYANSQFDRASEALRQPGSAFKPFVFLAAVEGGAEPDSIRNDAPVRYGKWRPENYGGKYYGPVSLTTALAKSLNSVAAQLMAETGPDTVIETAHRLGIVSRLESNASLALGTSGVTPLELTAAYVPFANGGFRPNVHFIRRVTTVSGEVLYENTDTGGVRVIRAEHVAMMNAMMQETIKSGTATRAAFGWPAAGKTGTSQKSRDAWFVGYTSNLTTGVWFGNDDGKPTKNVTGGSLPALAWKEFMTAAHDGVPVAQLPGRWQPSSAEKPAEALAVPADIFPAKPEKAASKPAQKPSAKPEAIAQKPIAKAAAKPAAKPAKPAAKPAQPEDQTASVPRPKADLGTAKPARREKTVLDVILGQ